MSICVYGRIKTKCINEELLKKILAEFFLSKDDIKIIKNRNCVVYEDITDKNEISISFISENKPPYNVYESTINNDEFDYVQLILFDIKKEEASIENYKRIISFLIHLKEKINSDILVTSDVHNDICLLEKEKIIWSDKLDFDYNSSV